MDDILGYAVEGVVARGPLATVYRARHPVGGFPVAVKVFSKLPHLAEDPDFVEAMDRDARQVAALRHPGIVPLVAWGVESERIVTVTRLVEGRSLQERLSEGPLEPAEATRIMHGVAEALAAAHAQGVLHRNLHAGNVLVEGIIGRPLLVDFSVTSAAAATQLLTSARPGLCGAGHMAPEEIRGQPLDSRADLYALGVTYYRALAGSLPFGEEEPVAVLERHLHEEPDLGPLRRRGVSPRMETVVQRCLAKAPGERYQQAGKVAADLSRALVSMAPPPDLPSEEVAGVAEAPPVPVPLAPTPARRDPRVLALFGAALLACLAAVWFVPELAAGRGEPPPPPPVATPAAFETAEVAAEAPPQGPSGLDLPVSGLVEAEEGTLTVDVSGERVEEAPVFVTVRDGEEVLAEATLEGRMAFVQVPLDREVTLEVGSPIHRSIRRPVRMAGALGLEEVELSLLPGEEPKPEPAEPPAQKPERPPQDPAPPPPMLAPMELPPALPPPLPPPAPRPVAEVSRPAEPAPVPAPEPRDFEGIPVGDGAPAEPPDLEKLEPAPEPAPPAAPPAEAPGSWLEEGADLHRP